MGDTKLQAASQLGNWICQLTSFVSFFFWCNKFITTILAARNLTAWVFVWCDPLIKNTGNWREASPRTSFPWKIPLYPKSENCCYFSFVTFWRHLQCCMVFGFFAGIPLCLFAKQTNIQQSHVRLLQHLWHSLLVVSFKWHPDRTMFCISVLIQTWIFTITSMPTTLRSCFEAHSSILYSADIAFIHAITLINIFYFFIRRIQRRHGPSHILRLRPRNKMHIHCVVMYHSINEM